jgi:2-amino-4-hydroxy-6-hydroxymethyldihydropteridine diphosphokinase
VSTPSWVPAYVGIGSNLDDPPAQVASAFISLGRLANSKLVARSRLYRTRPLGPQDQPEFVNAAAGMLTTLSARELLSALKELERTLGRAQPVVRWGPRRIDLDLLMYSDLRMAERDLVLPHAGLTERNFVLYPLRDIAPEVVVPGHGSVEALAARVGSDGLALLG